MSDEVNKDLFDSLDDDNIIDKELISDEVDDYENEDDISPENFKGILVTGSDWTIETIINQIKRKNIILSPNFQRRNVWNNKTKSAFIESILLNIPIPNILLGEDPLNKNKYLVIDGKQRLLTLAEFYGLEIDDTPSRKPFKTLTKLRVLKYLNGKSYKDFEKKLMPEKDIIDNFTIRTTMMKNISETSALYEVFARINTGSEKLSPQELRQSRFPGKFMDFLVEHTDSTSINEILKLNGYLHSRMKDTELLLRCYSFKYRLNYYDNSISKFLDGTVKEFNNLWDQMKDEINLFYQEILHAIDFIRDHFKEEAFSLIGLGREKLAFNRPIFDLMIYFFSNSQNRIKVDGYGKTLRDKFLNLITSDETFAFALTTNTHQTLHTRVRFKILYDYLKLNFHIENDPIIESISGDEVKRLSKIVVDSKS